MEKTKQRRFIALPPTGPPGYSRFCWWTVRDTSVDLRKIGNNIMDYYFAGLPGAGELAEDKADRYERGLEQPPSSPHYMGEP
jgi:hypothetical protein